jgi:hypothetical protein
MGRSWRNVAVPAMATVVGAMVGVAGTFYVERDKQERLNLELRRKDHLAFYAQLRLYLQATRNAFINQSAIRDALVELLEKNHGRLPQLEYEELFAKYYPRMTTEEKQRCGFLRGITEISLNKHNRDIVELLEKHPQYYDEVVSLKPLHDHLEFWLSKYHSQFKRPEICLIYVGVNEKKPFPPEVATQVDERYAYLQTFR